MSSKPTFVLVPGAWLSASTWDKVVSLLSTAGYKSVAVTLPSTSGDISASFLDDVEAVRAAITSETDASRDVVVVVHSYGGHVGQSALKGLPTRQDPGPKGKVLGLAMMATGFNRTGTSFLDGLGGTPPPSWRANAETGLAELLADPAELFFHDLPGPEAAAAAAAAASSLLRPHSLRSLAEGGEHAYAGWRDVPVRCLVTTRDVALPAGAQRGMVDEARGGGGADVQEVREVASGHCPMVSRPEETVAFLVDAARAFVGCG